MAIYCILHLLPHFGNCLDSKKYWKNQVFIDRDFESLKSIKVILQGASKEAKNVKVRTLFLNSGNRRFILSGN